MKERILAWEGCQNVRDLGGLRTRDGRETRFGVLVRSDTPSRLTVPGWQALHEHGIRTIITLRTIGKVEDELDISPPFPDLEVLNREIEDLTDKEFLMTWAATDLWCTPLYYKDALQRWPKRHAAVITAAANAPSGGVLFHCIRGNDRTGIISLLLLALAGVIPEDIVADYELSPDPFRDELLAREHATISDVLFAALDELDLEDLMRRSGASQDDLETLRRRLVS